MKALTPGPSLEPARIDTASRTIRAPAPTIFAAFAAREALETWLPPQGMTGSVKSFSFCEGGGFRMQLKYPISQNATGKTTDDTDEVVVQFARLVPYERVEQLVTFDSSDAQFEGTMRMTWLLEPGALVTQVTVLCEDVPIGVRAEDHQIGLDSTLENLAVFVEARSA